MPIYCVIVPPPLYSRGSWLKDRRGYGLFSPSSFDNPIFFCVWCSSLCSLNKSPVPALIIALPPKVWCAQGNWTSPVPAHYSTIQYCLPAKHTSTYSCTPSLRNIQTNTETHKKKKKKKREPIFLLPEEPTVLRWHKQATVGSNNKLATGASHLTTAVCDHTNRSGKRNAGFSTWLAFSKNHSHQKGRQEDKITGRKG